MSLLKIFLAVFLTTPLLSVSYAAETQKSLPLAKKLEFLKSFKSLQSVQTLGETFDTSKKAAVWGEFYKKNHLDLKNVSLEGFHAEGNKLFVPSLKEAIEVRNDQKTFTYKGVDYVIDINASPEKNFQSYIKSWGAFKEFRSQKSSVSAWNAFITEAHAEDPTVRFDLQAILYYLTSPYKIMQFLTSGIKNGVKDWLVDTAFNGIEVECDVKPPRFLKTDVRWGVNPPTNCNEDKYCESFTWENNKPAYYFRFPANDVVFGDLNIDKREQSIVIENLEKACQNPEQMAAINEVFRRGNKLQWEQKRDKLYGPKAPKPTPKQGAK